MRFRSSFSKILIAAVAIVAISPSAPAQPPTETQALKAEIESLKSEIDQLKKNQAAMLQQLGAIRDYLVRQNKPQNPEVDLKGAPMLGSPNAKFAIVEFTDYWCGFCSRFAKNTYPDIVKKYVDAGKVRYYVKDFPAQRGPKVAEAAHCAAEQNKYFAMHDKLFANYGKYGDAELARYAQEIGADTAALTSCLASGKYEKQVQAGMEQGSTAGVEGTPTFLIGTVDPADPEKFKTVKTIVGAQPLESFESAIDGVIAGTK
jgi:protein-disulfide isomerase